METLGSRKIISLRESRPKFHPVTNHLVRSDPGVEISTYPDLVEKIAQLSFYNPEHVLLFRGQSRDWPNIRGNTSLKPSIFRPRPSERSSPRSLELTPRYNTLSHAERLVAEEYSFTGRQRMVRYRMLRWAILQHYEVCPTPLLDVTHSVRVAASFATNDHSEAEPVLYVLGVPSLSGSITASSEQGIQIIRLSSICPPEARRPYFQEGYLLGEYPDLVTMDEKQNYHPYEIDFGRRLLAKFRLSRSGFWSKDYTAIPREALYPNERDPLVEFTEQIKARLTM
jgi:hypothetical protein